MSEPKPDTTKPISKEWCLKMAAFEGDQPIGAGLLARDPVCFPTVAEWRAYEPDGVTPDCPSCGQPFLIRPAWKNVSGIEEWVCEEGLCNGNGQ